MFTFTDLTKLLKGTRNKKPGPYWHKIVRQCQAADVPTRFVYVHVKNRTYANATVWKKDAAGNVLVPRVVETRHSYTRDSSYGLLVDKDTGFVYIFSTARMYGASKRDPVAIGRAYSIMGVPFHYVIAPNCPPEIGLPAGVSEDN